MLELVVVNETANCTGMIHAVCRKCYPVAKAGNRALCGAELQGIDHSGEIADCIVCNDIPKCPKEH